MSVKIAAVTGTRADYGLLKPLLKALSKEDFQLQIIATAMHLSPEFGNTFNEIEQDGFHIEEKLEILLSSDTSVGISKSIGLGVISFAEAYERLKPDLILLLGDRFEILAAAQAALIAKIPIAHIAGGDTTEGAWDESIRHSITKMASLHFVTNQDSWERVIQMGENPERVFLVGSPGIDSIHNMSYLSRTDLEKELDFSFRKKNILVTFHPATLEFNSAVSQFKQLLQALDRLGDDFGIIITKPNADLEGRALFPLIDSFTVNRPYVKSYTSLGHRLYLNVMKQVDMVVGNSSSGLYEAPSFKIPTINIGQRQKGRLQSSSVINCEPSEDAIYRAIEKGLGLDCSEVINPYGKGNTVDSIVSILKTINNYSSLILKPFFKL